MDDKLKNMLGSLTNSQDPEEIAKMRRLMTDYFKELDFKLPSLDLMYPRVSVVQTPDYANFYVCSNDVFRTHTLTLKLHDPIKNEVIASKVLEEILDKDYKKGCYKISVDKVRRAIIAFLVHNNYEMPYGDLCDRVDEYGERNFPGWNGSWTIGVNHPKK